MCLSCTQACHRVAAFHLNKQAVGCYSDNGDWWHAGIDCTNRVLHVWLTHGQQRDFGGDYGFDCWCVIIFLSARRHFFLMRIGCRPQDNWHKQESRKLYVSVQRTQLLCEGDTCANISIYVHVLQYYELWSGMLQKLSGLSYVVQVIYVCSKVLTSTKCIFWEWILKWVENVLDRFSSWLGADYLWMD